MLSSDSGISHAVVTSLRDHPHADTAHDVAARLTLVAVEDVLAALEALRADGLVIEADGHWQLSGRGWKAVRLHRDAEGPASGLRGPAT